MALLRKASGPTTALPYCHRPVLPSDANDGNPQRSLLRISAVYPSARLLSRKVKLFVEFMQSEFLKIPLLHPRSPSRPVPRIRSKPGVAVPAKH